MDLQDVVDDLAARVGRPIEVEDRRWRLLAHSAHDAASDADPVRTATILRRQAPPEVAAWLDGLGLDARDGVVDVPANPELDMAARVCAPLRHGTVRLGFLWVLTPDRPLGEAERERVAEAADAARALLWLRRRRVEERGALVDDLLAGGAAGNAARQTLGWSTGAPLVVGVAAGPADELAAGIGRFWPGGAVAVAERAGPAIAIAQLPAGLPPVALATALLQAGAARAATSDPAVDQAGLGAALGQARAALAVLEAVPGGEPAATFSALGAWGVLADLWLRAGRGAPPAVVGTLGEARGGPALVEAAEAFLDAGGDAVEAAAALHVHRATLYRRIERVGELTGLDLRRGEDRLLLHVALRLRRLDALSP